MKAVARTNKKLIHKNKFWVSLLLAQFFLFYMVSRSKYLIELNGLFFEIQKKCHQQLFSVFPFSVGDVLYVAIFIVINFLIIKAVLKKKKSYLIYLLIGLNIIYPIYQVFWGLLYFQAPILEHHSTIKTSEKNLEKLAYKYLRNCIELRKGLNTNDKGVFTLKSVDKTVFKAIASQNNIPAQFKLKKATAVISVKPSLYSGIISYTGIMGYYNPFTAEAQYNAQLPHTKLPITIAHETAHQLGYAREQEASFIGYLMCLKSNDKELQYTANYYALQNVLNALIDSNESLVMNIITKYSDEMKRDRNYEKEFFENHSGQLSQLFSWSNDLFLKSNQQEGSITYSYFINLLLYYEGL